MKWTKEQQEAIELRNKNILVSAAAGSGKTAVLVERIKRLIIEEKCPVDRMLIVTFTNAAAAEMKEKIRKSLSQALEDVSAGGSASQEGSASQGDGASQADSMSSGDGAEKQAFLKKQLDLLGTANISTFHSFALDVIRRYFYIIDIEPNFKICDSTQEALLKGEAMDKLLDELFEAGEPEFFHFLKCYSGDRDESRFRSIVSGCYDTIRSLPEPFAWLRESVEQLKDGRGFDSGTAAGQLFEAAEEKLRVALKAIAANKDTAENLKLPLLTELCQKDEEQLSMLEEAVQSRDYEAFREAVRAFKLPVMSSKIFASAENADEIKKAAGDNRDSAKKQIKSLKEVYFSGSLDELRHEMALTYDSAAYLEKLLIRYDQIYKSEKAKKNVADFSDIEHYAYEILKDGEAAEFYRSRFRHIFIDEYQDSNVIQEALIDLIKRPDNLFMVGDVKQSIYKFRLAEPEIFQKKYRSYRDGLMEASVKIDLNKNFRSKRPVIDFINGLCSAVMEGYDEDAALYAGDMYADEAFHSPELYLAQVPWDEDSEIDEELKNIMKAEKEALCAARIIRDSLRKPFFDSKTGEEKLLEKRDIVILMRGVRNYGDVFYKVLADNNIPAYIDDSDGFFNTIEIDSFLSALYIIDNPKQDIPLLTLMRSEMLGFSIEEMVRIRIEFKSGSYYDAFADYALRGGDDALRRKCAGAFDKIASWRQLSHLLPLDKLIWKLLLDTDFYIAMGALPAGSQRQANLRALTDKALAYQSSGGGSLYGFIRYVEAIKENKVSMGQVKLLGEKDDLVRIMTVHKSKGLEFPMVLMAGFCRRLTYSSAGRAPVIHKDLGIGFPVVDAENRWYRATLLQNMIKDRFRKEEVEEEKRILYVALTRAKDRLIMLGICGDVKKEMEKVCRESPKDSSYFAMTGKVICAELGAAKIIEDSWLLGISKGRRRSTGKILELMESAEHEQGDISPEIERKLSFSYLYSGNLKVKSKYSVSELNSGYAQMPETLREPVFNSFGDESRENKPVAEFSAVARGNIYHSVLEHLDVAKARAEGDYYLSGLMESLVSDEILFPEEAEIVDLKKISDFAASELGGRIAASRSVYRERPFNMVIQHEGKYIIVQGIIDCYFEEEDHLVLVDYKTGRAENAAEKYKVQIDLYRQALEKAAGKKVRDAYLYMTDAGRIIKMQP